MKKIAILLLLPLFLLGENDEYDFGIKSYRTNYLVHTYDFRDNRARKNRGEVKFQISAKHDFSYDLFGLGEINSFAYTQLSFWGVMENSMPFYETNYMPELFMTFPSEGLQGNLDFIRFGLLHHSNGLDGNVSRSWNRVYVSAKFDFGDFSVIPRIWQSFYVSNLNRDINSYLGRTDFELRYKNGRNKFRAILANNLDFKHNHTSFELSYFVEIANGTHWYLQYFDGYGENLIGYKKYTQRIGMGFGLIR